MFLDDKLEACPYYKHEITVGFLSKKLQFIFLLFGSKETSL